MSQNKHTYWHLEDETFGKMEEMEDMWKKVSMSGWVFIKAFSGEGGISNTVLSLQTTLASMACTTTRHETMTPHARQLIGLCFIPSDSAVSAQCHILHLCTVLTVPILGSTPVWWKYNHPLCHTQTTHIHTHTHRIRSYRKEQGDSHNTAWHHKNITSPPTPTFHLL